MFSGRFYGGLIEPETKKYLEKKKQGNHVKRSAGSGRLFSLVVHFIETFKYLCYDKINKA